ncbi:uncharacterized protein LOC143885008 isoform X2 [Tasmannia lanceolata]|uniref:uncharacterized protein LOC143885008 isoform X2 n=1 Tax=Tasmannia lanceolata TaxID=3420 RepID=UPI004064BAE4
MMVDMGRWVWGLTTTQVLSIFVPRLAIKALYLINLETSPSSTLEYEPITLATIQVGRSPYRGGGRRGGGTFRGGRSNFGPHYPRPDRDSGSPSGRGRGRTNRGGGRRFSQPSFAAPSLHPAHSSEPPAPPAAEPAVEQTPTNTKTSIQAPAPPPAPSRRPPQVAWCELCMVDCNSLEILEQHMNGRRHKKALQRYEELQNHKKLMAESQAKVPEPPGNVQVGEENKASTKENLSVAASTDDNGTETAQQNQTVEQSEVEKVELSGEPERRPRADSFDRRRAPKRNMKFGRGGKRMRMSDMRNNPEQPKELPMYCELCHVTCDTQAVFEVHLAGKKHTSRVKRSQFHPGYHRPLGLHSLYMPHAEPVLIPQVHIPLVMYGSQGHDPLVQQTAYEHQGPPPASYQFNQAQPNEEPKEVIPEPENQPSVSVEHEGQNNVMKNFEGQNTVNLEGQDAVTMKAGDQNAISESEAMEFTSAPDNPIPESKDTKMGAEHAFPTTEYGVSSAEVVVEPKVEEPDHAFPIMEYGVSSTELVAVPKVEEPDHAVPIMEYGVSSAEMVVVTKVEEPGSNM